MPKSTLMLLALILSLTSYTTGAQASPPPTGESTAYVGYYDIPVGADISEEVFRGLRKGMTGPELELIIGRPPTLLKRDVIEGRIFMEFAWRGPTTDLEIYTEDNIITGWAYGTYSSQ